MTEEEMPVSYYSYDDGNFSWIYILAIYTFLKEPVIFFTSDVAMNFENEPQFSDLKKWISGSFCSYLDFHLISIFFCKNVKICPFYVILFIFCLQFSTT